MVYCLLNSCISGLIPQIVNSFIVLSKVSQSIFISFNCFIHRLESIHVFVVLAEAYIDI